MKILESYTTMAKSLLLEDDDDRYVHIGYGKYKEKDSRTGEPLPNSPVYIKTDAGKYIMPDDDDDKGGEEKPKGGGMGSGDLAACILSWLIGIPAMTICLLSYLEKQEMYVFLNMIINKLVMVFV